MMLRRKFRDLPRTEHAGEKFKYFLIEYNCIEIEIERPWLLLNIKKYLRIEGYFEFNIAIDFLIQDDNIINLKKK